MTMTTARRTAFHTNAARHLGTTRAALAVLHADEPRPSRDTPARTATVTDTRGDRTSDTQPLP